MLIHAVASARPVSNMLNKLHGQPESYEKKSKYRFGRTLGAGTYGIVREAEGPMGKVAVKIILKKNVKGNSNPRSKSMSCNNTLERQ